MCDIFGKSLGPAIPENVATAAPCAVFPEGDLVAVGDHARKTISLFNWRTGRRLWRLKGWKDLGQLIVSDRDKLLAHQHTGWCTLISIDGEVRDEVDRVVSVCADSLEDRVLVVRGDRHSAHRVMECRRGLASVHYCLGAGGLVEVPHGVIERDWIALCDRSREVVVGIDGSGNVLWEYAVRSNHGGFVIGMSASQDRRIVALMIRYERRSETVGSLVMLDGLTGRFEQRTEFVDGDFAIMPTGGSGCFVAAGGARIAYPQVRIDHVQWQRPN